MDIEKTKLHEKLVALLDDVLDECDSMCRGCGDCRYFPMQSCTSHKQADHLIANGVKVQEWVPVTERLPDGECLAVSMLKYQPSYKEMLVGYVAKDARYETGYCCESDDVILPNVTHWTEKHYPAEGGE